MTDREKAVLKYIYKSMYKMYYEEADLLAKTKELLELLGPECLFVRQETTNKRGISDILLCYKGRFVGIELKAIDGKLEIQQKEFIDKVIAAGGIAGECKCLSDVWNLLIKAKYS